MNLYTTVTFMHKELRLRFIFKFILLILFTSHMISASAQFDDESTNKGLSRKKWPPVIHKISEIGLPLSMVKRIRKYTKLDMDSTYIGGEDYHESFAEKDDNNVFEDYVVKIMLRFVGGNIVGFIKKEPMMQSNKGKYEMTQIDIPIEWCAIDSLKQEHCAKTPQEIKELDSVAKPQDWHQKLDPNELAENKVEANFDLLHLLDSKSGRKQLKSKKLLDSLISVASNLTGDDSVFAARRISLIQKEMQVAARKKKGIAALDDSTIASITTGLTGSDSINAIKTYVAEQKVMKDKKFIKAEKSLDSTTIASLTQGLSPTDSIKAIRKYLLGAMATKRTKKTRGAPDKLNPAIANLPNDSTGIGNTPPVIAIKPSKSDKKKKKGDELDDITIAKITSGLTGTDSINAIKEYKLAAKKGKDTKKKKGKPVEQIVLADSSSQTAQPITTNNQSIQQTNSVTPPSSTPASGNSLPIATPSAPSVSNKPSKTDKKKKKGNDELDESTIATITKGLTGEDSINAIKEYKLEAKKGKDTKKKKGNQKVEQVVTSENTSSSTPALSPSNKIDTIVVNTPVLTTSKDTNVNVVVPTLPPSSEGRKRVIDSAAIKENSTKDSASVKPSIPQADNKKEEDKTKETIPSALKDSAVATKPVVAPVETKKVEERVREAITAITPTDTTLHAAIPNPIKDSSADVKPIVPSIEPKKVEEKAKEVVPTPSVDSSSIKKDIPPVQSTPVIESKPPVADTTKQAMLPPVVKDSTAVALPVVPPVENKPSRQRVEFVVPPTVDSTANKPKLPSDSSIVKPSTDTIGVNKIVVPSDTTKPK